MLDYDDSIDLLADDIEDDREQAFRKSNRQKVKSPKTGKAWCLHCDRVLGGVAETCPHCGGVIGGFDRKHRPMRKETSAR